MQLQGITINEGNRHIPSGTFIVLFTDENITINSLLSITYKEKPLYFEVNSVSYIPDMDKYTVTAKQKGYYNMLYNDKNANIKDFYQNSSKLEIVTDESIIKQIQMESTYC